MRFYRKYVQEHSPKLSIVVAPMRLNELVWFVPFLYIPKESQKIKDFLYIKDFTFSTINIMLSLQ